MAVLDGNLYVFGGFRRRSLPGRVAGRRGCVGRPVGGAAQLGFGGWLVRGGSVPAGRVGAGIPFGGSVATSG